MFKRKVHSHLHMLHLHFGPGNVLMNFYNEVVDLIYLFNIYVFPMFALKTLKLLFPNFVVLSTDI